MTNVIAKSRTVKGCLHRHSCTLCTLSPYESGSQLLVLSSLPLIFRDLAGQGPFAPLRLRQGFGVRLFGDRLNLPVPPMSLALGRDAALLTRNKTGAIVE